MSDSVWPHRRSPLGSAVPGILQARTLEWVAISFSNAWKWKVKVKSLSRVRLLATPWTAAYQAPPSMGFSRQEYWRWVPLPSPRHIRRWHNVPGSSWIPPTLDLQLANKKWNLKTSVWTLWMNWIYRLNWGEITVHSIDSSYLGICCHYLIHFLCHLSMKIILFTSWIYFFPQLFERFFLLWWFF